MNRLILPLKCVAITFVEAQIVNAINAIRVAASTKMAVVVRSAQMVDINIITAVASCRRKGW